MSRNNKVVPSSGNADSQIDGRIGEGKNNPVQQQQESSGTILKQQQNSMNDQTQENKYTCRICLEQSPSLHANNEDQLGHLLKKLLKQTSSHEPKYVISTCKCQGTSGYVHHRCIIQWVDAQYKRTREKHMKCEICLEEILYEKKTIGYFECSLSNMGNLSPCNIVCFASVLIVLGAFIVLQTQAEILGLNELTRLTIFVLMGVFAIALIFSSILLVKEAFYKRRKETVKVLTNDEIEIRGVVKDSLTHYDRRSTTHRTQLTNLRSARTIRSARSIRWEGERGRQRVGSGRGQRSERINTGVVQGQRQQGEVIIRSMRVIRNGAQSARTVQIRSREQLEEVINI